MKKKFLAFATACACTFTGIAAFTGCGLFGGSEYELVSAVFKESERTQDWVYLNSPAVEDVVYYPPTLCYIVDVTVKDKKGNEKTGEIRVSPYSTRTSLFMDNTVHAYLSVGITVEGYDDSAIAANKPLTIKLSSGLEDSEIKTGECELTTTYSVVHALKKIEINENDVKTDYALNEEFAGLPMTVTYEDDTTEVMDFEELTALPQYEENSSVTGFDSTRLGMHKALSVNNFQTSATGSRTSTLYYNVLPDLTIWEKGSSSTGADRFYYEYYKTTDMTFGRTTRNGYYMDNVTFGNVNMLLWTTQGVAVNPDKTTFENAMNSTSSSNAFFHAPIPAGQTVTVNELTKAANYYKLDYDCYEGSVKASSNTLYLVYSTNPQKMISVTLENSDMLSADETALTQDFINLLWFK